MIGTALAIKLDVVEFLKYLAKNKEDRRQSDCDHNFMESESFAPFCSKCDKTFTTEETARFLMKVCPHTDLELIGYNSGADIFLCSDCKLKVYR